MYSDLLKGRTSAVKFSDMFRSEIMFDVLNSCDKTMKIPDHWNTQHLGFFFLCEDVFASLFIKVQKCPRNMV